MRWPALGAFLHRLRPWHALVAIALTGLIYATMVSSAPELPLLLAAVVVLALFYRAWRHEFVVADGAVPTTSSPAGTTSSSGLALMILLPPVGFSCFRNYRRSQSARGGRRTRTPSPTPIHDLV